MSYDSQNVPRSIFHIFLYKKLYKAISNNSAWILNVSPLCSVAHWIKLISRNTWSFINLTLLCSKIFHLIFFDCSNLLRQVIVLPCLGCAFHCIHIDRHNSGLWLASTHLVAPVPLRALTVPDNFDQASWSQSHWTLLRRFSRSFPVRDVCSFQWYILRFKPSTLHGFLWRTSWRPLKFCHCTHRDLTSNLSRCGLGETVF